MFTYLVNDFHFLKIFHILETEESIFILVILEPVFGDYTGRSPLGYLWPSCAQTRCFEIEGSSKRFGYASGRLGCN